MTKTPTNYSKLFWLVKVIRIQILQNWLPILLFLHLYLMIMFSIGTCQTKQLKPIATPTQNFFLTIRNKIKA